MPHDPDQPGQDPVFSPRQNVIEACAQLAQVEEHLRKVKWYSLSDRDPRECADCVDKHLQLARTYAQEISSLDTLRRWGPEESQIRAQIRSTYAALEAGADPRWIADQIRPIRKACLRRTRRFKLQRSVSALKRGFKKVVTKRNLGIAAGVAGIGWWLKR